MGKFKRILSQCNIWRCNILIFVILGTQKFQFNRLLIEIDNLIEAGVIKDKVVAQIGNSTYYPQNFEYFKFLDKNRFDQLLSNSEVVICHGGTGAIINAMRQHKKIIAVPRLSKFNEHIDDHQLEIVKVFTDNNIVACCYEMENLKKIYTEINNYSLNTTYRFKGNIIDIIKDFSIDMSIENIREKYKNL